MADVLLGIDFFKRESIVVFACLLAEKQSVKRS